MDKIILDHKLVTNEKGIIQLPVDLNDADAENAFNKGFVDFYRNCGRDDNPFGSNKLSSHWDAGFRWAYRLTI